jgi:hypothetical protein
MLRVSEKLRIGWITAGLGATVLLGTWMAARTPRAAAAATSSAAHALNADHGYYAMINGRLEKWDFHSDGTFLHEGVAGGAGAYSRGSERGTYSISGDKLVLKIGNTATAFGGGTASHAMLGGSASAATQTREMKIQLLGADGADGVVLNGVIFHIRHGW